MKTLEAGVTTHGPPVFPTKMAFVLPKASWIPVGLQDLTVECCMRRSSMHWSFVLTLTAVMIIVCFRRVIISNLDTGSSNT